LFWSIASKTIVTIERSDDGGIVQVKHQGFLSMIVSSFHESVNLLSFCLADVFVLHKQVRQFGQEALFAINHQPHGHKLINVELCALIHL
jgi:hypothetical protein